MLNWFKRRRKPNKRIDPIVMEKVLHMIAATQQNELDCGEVYAVLDQFAEAARRGENVLSLMPLVRQHLEMCADCREEYEALLRMLQPAF